MAELPASELLPIFEQIRTTDENCWTLMQQVSCSPVFEQITDKNGLTPIQRVSHYPIFKQIRTTDQIGWTPIQYVSCSPLAVFEQIADENG